MPVELVRALRGIPRTAQYPDCADYWDRVPHPHESGGDDDSAEVENAIRRMLDELPKREADVLRMRYWIDRESKMTLEEVGEHMGLTSERVRQIEARALERISIPGRKRRLKKLLGR